MQETWVQFLGWEVPLEKEMATHSSILAWRIPWTEESGRVQSMGSQESDITEATQPTCTHLFLYPCVFGCAVSSLLCGLFSSYGKQELLFIAVCGFLIAEASLVAKLRLQGSQASGAVAPRLQSAGSIVVALGLSCSTACEIFLDCGWKPSSIYQQADHLPLSHQRSPFQD